MREFIRLDSSKISGGWRKGLTDGDVHPVVDTEE